MGDRPLRPVLALVFLSLNACAPVLHIEVPPPGGPYAVGRTTLTLVDSSRADPWVTSAERRVVLVKGWYPADRASHAPDAAYLPNASDLPGRFSFGERFIAKHLDAHALEEPPVAGNTRYPVIVFSSGNDMSPDFYSGIIDELVSRGYVVLGLDHSFEGKGQILPDGRRLPVEVDKQRPPESASAILDFYRMRAELRAADVSFVLTELAARMPASPLAGHLDFDRIGAMGHSVGGVAAAQSCRRDARIRACVNLDGLVMAKPILADNGSFALAQPFLLLGKPLPFTNPAVNDSARHEIDAALASGSGGAYDVIVAETHHDTFSDYPFFTPTFRPVRNRANLAIIRSVTLAFFDKTLRGLPAPILDDSTSLDAGRVRITRLAPRH